MNGWQIFLIVFCGMALAQSLFLGTMMLAKDRFNLSALFYLGVMLLGLAFRLIKSYFVFIPQSSYPEAGIVAGGVGLWIVGPAYYLYTRHSLQPQARRTYWNMVHFLPSAMVIFAPPRYAYYVGLLHFFVYYVVSLCQLKPWASRKLPRHFAVFVLCTGLILLCLIIQASQGGVRVYTIGVGVAIVILYVINYFIAKDTSFLNAITKKSKELDKTLALKITTEVAQYIFERKIYRNKGLKVSELAKQTNYPAYLISQSINQHYNIRFNEFLKDSACRKPWSGLRTAAKMTRLK
jgi:hypothetical protein